MGRKVTAALFSSIDGVVGDPGTFQYDSFDEDLGATMTRTIAGIDEVILGRVTYSQWADYWPTQAPEEDADYASFINPVLKHVASRTLTQSDLTWENSRLVEGDLLDLVRTLKASEGGDIAVQGSLSVVRQLVAAGLLDELTLVIHPAVAGSGERLFADFAPTRLRLVNLERTRAGNVVATYGPFEGSEG